MDLDGAGGAGGSGFAVYCVLRQSVQHRAAPLGDTHTRIEHAREARERRDTGDRDDPRDETRETTRNERNTRYPRTYSGHTVSKHYFAIHTAQRMHFGPVWIPRPAISTHSTESTLNTEPSSVEHSSNPVERQAVSAQIRRRRRMSDSVPGNDSPAHRRLDGACARTRRRRRPHLRARTR